MPQASACTRDRDGRTELQSSDGGFLSPQQTLVFVRRPHRQKVRTAQNNGPWHILWSLSNHSSGDRYSDFPKPAKPEPNRDFERTPPSAVWAIFWMICRFTSARIFPQRGSKLSEPNGFEPLRRVHDRIIRVFWPINFAHKR